MVNGVQRPLFMSPQWQAKYRYYQLKYAPLIPLHLGKMCLGRQLTEPVLMSMTTQWQGKYQYYQRNTTRCMININAIY